MQSRTGTKLNNHPSKRQEDSPQKPWSLPAASPFPLKPTRPPPPSSSVASNRSSTPPKRVILRPAFTCAATPPHSMASKKRKLRLLGSKSRVAESCKNACAVPGRSSCPGKPSRGADRSREACVFEPVSRRMLRDWLVFLLGVSNW